MKRYLNFLLFVCFYGSVLFAQDKQTDMKKAWQEYMTPGPMHEVLARRVGEWKSDLTLWTNPTSAPSKAHGTAVYESVFDGKYFEGKFSSEMMGMQMEGREITGYDNAKKKFFSFWVDNFGTGFLMQEGTYDEKSGTINLEGSYTDFNGEVLKVRQTFKYPDADHGITEMYMFDKDGQPWKSMEINYTRVK